jgi:uncharacterized protein
MALPRIRRPISNAAPDDFRPAWLLRGGHAQTIAGYFRDEAGAGPPAVLREVPLADGDRLALHESAPAPGRPPNGSAVLLVHGLAGCHRSSYMRRIAGKLVAAGTRVFRLDLRMCGAGAGWATKPYHAGQSADVREALAAIAGLAPDTPVRLVGFSLGGSVALKLAGEPPAPPNLAAVLAVCPPIDLEFGVRRLANTAALRAYDRYFAKALVQQVGAWQAANPAAPRVGFARPPRGILEIDELVTAPFAGFASASDYYRHSSPGQYLGAIRVPTEILAAADDPLVPPGPLRAAAISPAVRRREIPAGGGHSRRFGP